MNRGRLAVALAVLGLAGIVWGVLHVVEAANGPGLGPTQFADRVSYNQAKQAMHQSFLGGLLRAGLGAGLLWAASRLRAPATAQTE